MELNVKWADYKAIIDKIESIEKRTDEITAERQRRGGDLDYMRETYNALWATRDKLEARRDEMRPRLIPEVGMPCTVRWFSDSSGAHVEKVISPKKIQVKCDGIYSCTKIFTHRKNGHWVEAGSTTRDWSTLLSLGYRHDYYDQSF